jgi:N-acetylneuraminate synthase
MTVLGAVGLYDCCAVEKHFTFDNTKEGQDHSFSMTPESWSQMAKQTQDLKDDLRDQSATSFEQRLAIVNQHVDDPKALALSIGDGIKKLESNEMNTVIVQRRAVRATRDLKAGDVLIKSDLYPLRPCPADAISPADIDSLVGKTLNADVPEGAHFALGNLD